MCFQIQLYPTLADLRAKFSAKINHEAFANISRLITDQVDIKIKHATEDGRVYPNYVTPVLTQENRENVISPMRYRIRPHDSAEEVPTKYNVFNARLDSLTNRKTWSAIFGKNHGVVAFNKFYEWIIEDNGRKKLISFYPEDQQLMIAPCLYDNWVSKDGKIAFNSFAIITTDPPQEILDLGHDRCPIFLKSEYLDQWLSPVDVKTSLEILNDPFQIKYQSDFKKVSNV